jgi:hypothetical protein
MTESLTRAVSVEVADPCPDCTVAAQGVRQAIPTAPSVRIPITPDLHLCRLAGGHTVVLELCGCEDSRWRMASGRAGAR